MTQAIEHVSLNHGIVTDITVAFIPVFFQEEEEDGSMVVPGPAGMAGGTGATGATGAQGLPGITVLADPDVPDELMPIPGPQGLPGVTVLPPGYLYALMLSWVSVSAVAVAAGSCVDSTNGVNIVLASALTKSITAPWAAGTGQGGMGTGLAAGASTTYHAFAIVNAGSADVYFDSSPVAANAPSGTTAHRRIGSFLTI